MERTARRNRIQTRHRAVNLFQPIALCVNIGNRPHQPQRVGMLRPVNDVGDVADLHDLPRVHHRHAVCGFSNDPHIVRNEEHGHLSFPREFSDEFHNLRLNRHVKRRRRLVRNQEFRVARECERNHDSLALAAGKLMRPMIHPTFRRRNPGFLK